MDSLAYLLVNQEDFELKWRDNIANTKMIKSRIGKKLKKKKD